MIDTPATALFTTDRHTVRMRWRHLAGVLILLTAAGTAGCTARRPQAAVRPARQGAGAVRRPPAAPSSVPPRPRGMVFHGARDSGMVALTFDADMTHGMWRSLDAGRIRSSYDHRIIATLDA